VAASPAASPAVAPPPTSSLVVAGKFAQPTTPGGPERQSPVSPTLNSAAKIATNVLDSPGLLRRAQALSEKSAKILATVARPAGRFEPLKEQLKRFIELTEDEEQELLNQFEKDEDGTIKEIEAKLQAHYEFAAKQFIESEVYKTLVERSDTDNKLAIRWARKLKGGELTFEEVMKRAGTRIRRVQENEAKIAQTVEKLKAKKAQMLTEATSGRPQRGRKVPVRFTP
jgi:hypothetical protein